MLQLSGNRRIWQQISRLPGDPRLTIFPRRLPNPRRQRWLIRRERFIRSNAGRLYGCGNFFTVKQQKAMSATDTPEIRLLKSRMELLGESRESLAKALGYQQNYLGMAIRNGVPCPRLRARLETALGCAIWNGQADFVLRQRCIRLLRYDPRALGRNELRARASELGITLKDGHFITQKLVEDVMAKLAVHPDLKSTKKEKKE